MVIAARLDPELRVPVGPWPVGPFTWDEVQEFPDDVGLRYELIDGILLMSPAPSHLHQRIVRKLLILLDRACPEGHEALSAPFDWYITESTYFEPDLLLVPRAGENERRFEGIPLLAVEILSPGTRRRDHGIKKSAYADAGLEWYWVVDPDVPDLTVFHLDGLRYVEHARVAGSDAYETDEPLPVRVVPEDLLKA